MQTDFYQVLKHTSGYHVFIDFPNTYYDFRDGGFSTTFANKIANNGRQFYIMLPLAKTIEQEKKMNQSCTSVNFEIQYCRNPQAASFRDQIWDTWKNLNVNVTKPYEGNPWWCVLGTEANSTKGWAAFPPGEYRIKAKVYYMGGVLGIDEMYSGRFRVS